MEPRFGLNPGPQSPRMRRRVNTEYSCQCTIGVYKFQFSSVDGLVTRFKSHCRRSAWLAAPDTALLHRDGDALGRVGRLLGRLGHLMIVLGVLGVVVAMFVVKSLQREAPMCLLSSAAPLGYVRVVFTHCLSFIYL